jgi:hypothetical protein
MKILLKTLPADVPMAVVFLSLVFWGVSLYPHDYTEYSDRLAEVVSIDAARHVATFKLPDGAVFDRRLTPEQYKRLEVGQSETVHLRGVDIKETLVGDLCIILSMVSFATALALFVMWTIGFSFVENGD